MDVVIIARRERPITRPGQVEKVLDKFKIGPASYAGPAQIGWMSTFNWSQNEAGSLKTSKLRRKSPLLAQSGLANWADGCLLLVVKRTSFKRASMSAFDPKRT